MFDDSIVNVFRKQSEISKVINPPSLQFISKQEEFLESMFPAVYNLSIASSSLSSSVLKSTSMFSAITNSFEFSHGVKGLMGQYNEIQGVTKATKSLHKALGMTGQLQGVAGMAKHLRGVMGVAFTIYESSVFRRNSDVFKSVIGIVNSDTFSSIVTDIDWSISEDDNLDFQDDIEKDKKRTTRQESTASFEGTLTVEAPKKTYVTAEEVEEMINKRVTKEKRVLKVGALFGFIFEEYVRDVAVVLVQILFMVFVCYTTDVHNAEVRTKIVEVIDESKTVRDIRKLTTNVLNDSTYGKHIAFLRTDAVLREGRSTTAPAVERVTKKTVLFVVERKGNWLHVQVENDNGCFYGWVEESKVVKFKKVKDMP